MATPGTKSVLKIGDAAVGDSPTLRDISDALSEAGVDQSVDTDETTALGDTAKSYVATLEDGTISFDGHFTNAANKVYDVVKSIKRLTVPFEYYPVGEGAGNPIQSGNCILTAFNVSSNVQNRVQVSGSFQITGGVTEGTDS